MSAGKGFIALAALVFAKVAALAGAWRPACCSASSTPWRPACKAWSCRSIGAIPVQAIQSLPYILTVVLLAGFIGKAIPPRASGIPYVKER